jgi:F-type H+-transporting ATPase subunit epsilon
MANEFQLLVITPDRVLVERPVASIRVPGTDGFFGILPNHAPMLAAVGAGPLSIHDTAGQIENMFIADGFLEVRNNKVRVVVDSGEPVTEIDLKRAEEAETRARERIAVGPKGDIDFPRAELALRRAIQRQTVARKYRG